MVIFPPVRFGSGKVRSTLVTEQHGTFTVKRVFQKDDGEYSFLLKHQGVNKNRKESSRGEHENPQQE